MNCYAHQLACAAAGATAIIYTLGCIAVHVYPHYMQLLWAPLVYISQQSMPVLEINLTGYGYGVVQSFVYTYVYARIFGALYSRLLPEL